MIQYTVNIDGMACGMCESHIADVIRKLDPKAKKVKASYKKKVATFRSENEIAEETIKNAIEETGYHYMSMSKEEL